MPEYNEYPPYIVGVTPEDTNQVQHQTLDNLDFERSGHTGFLGSSQNPAQTLSNSFILQWLSGGVLLKVDSNKKIIPAVPGVDYSIGTALLDITEDYTVEDTDSLLICNSESLIQITLNNNVGQLLMIKNVGPATVEIIGTIDDTALQLVEQWENIHLICYSSGNWAIL